MAIKGSLKEAGLADVCQLLSMGQKTGCLSITDRSRFGQIYFDRGRITFASIVNRRDRLGDLLVQDGVVTYEQLSEAVDAQGAEPDRRLGEILLERGLLDSGTLTAAVRKQIEDAIYYLFTWKRGSFYFEGGRTPGSGEILVSVNPERILLEGARRVDEWSLIERRVPSLDLVFGVDEERVRQTGVELTTDQETLIPLIDGRRSVQAIAEAAGLDEFATGKALYGLIHAGFVHRVGRKPAADEGQPADPTEALNLGLAFYRTGMLEDAERELQRVLRLDPHHAVARHYTALVALRQRRPADAVRRLSALLEAVGPRIGAQLNLAYALRLQGRSGDALRVLAMAADAAPDDARIPLAEGATLLAAGEPRRAMERLHAYARLKGAAAHDSPVYAHCAALAAAAVGEGNAARTLVDEGLAAHPGSPPLLLLNGVLAERREDVTAAERAYSRAVAEDPTLAQAHKSLGDLAMEQGSRGRALEHYRRAMEADPRLGDDLYTRLGDLHFRRNEREEAVRCWRTALELNPENPVAKSHLEVVSRAAG